jgi:DNA-binding MarR family transcriptional regulator
MSGPNPIAKDNAGPWLEYRENFSRHLLGVTRYLQTQIMNTLQEDCGHRALRLGFAPYITLIGEHRKRISDLADILGVSRQACNQAANQIEAAGYVAREADPDDRRAKQLVLTRQGRKLRQDGMRIAAGLDEEFTRIAGQQAIVDTSKTLAKIHGSLPPGLMINNGARFAEPSLGGLLPRMSDYTLLRLMELTRQRGHPGLKLSFGQVLTLIGPGGGRIQEIATIQHVSKQAISATATELEQLGYLYRETDPCDGRQVVLHFTSRGRDLITDSVASVRDLEAEFAAIAGKAPINRLKNTMRALYQDLELEQEVFGINVTADIKSLAQQIQQQLAAEDCQALAHILLAPTQSKR